MAIGGVTALIGSYVGARSTLRAGVCAAGVTFLLLAVKWGCDRLMTDGTRSAKTAARRRDFDWSMHYFRGLAIVAIVLGHLVEVFGHPALHKAFFYNATVYFIFISGYLCQYLHRDRSRFETTDFFRRKALNVICPYLACSTATVAIVLAIGTPQEWMFNPFGASAVRFVRLYGQGLAQVPYWFIPFVSILFLLSPAMLKLDDRGLMRLFALSLVPFALMSERGGLFTLQPVPFLMKFFFFFPAYVFGFVYARKRVEIERTLGGCWPVLLLFAGVLGVLIACPGLFGFHLTNVDLATNVQKLVLLIVIVRFLGFVRDRRIAVLDALAKYSFAMFFLHVFFLFDFVRLRDGVVRAGNLLAAEAAIAEVALAVVYVAFVCAVSAVLKLAIGRHSRSFVGA